MQEVILYTQAESVSCECVHSIWDTSEQRRMKREKRNCVEGDEGQFVCFWACRCSRERLIHMVRNAGTTWTRQSWWEREELHCWQVAAFPCVQSNDEQIGWDIYSSGQSMSSKSGKVWGRENIIFCSMDVVHSSLHILQNYSAQHGCKCSFPSEHSNSRARLYFGASATIFRLTDTIILHIFSIFVAESPTEEKTDGFFLNYIFMKRNGINVPKMYS